MGLVRPLLSLGRKCVLVMVCVFTLDWSLPLRQAAASSVAKTLSEKIVPTRAPPLRPGGLLSDPGPPLRPGASSQTSGLLSDQGPPLGLYSGGGAPFPGQVLGQVCVVQLVLQPPSILWFNRLC